MKNNVGLQRLNSVLYYICIKQLNGCVTRNQDLNYDFTPSSLSGWFGSLYTTVLMANAYSVWQCLALFC